MVDSSSVVLRVSGLASNPDEILAHHRFAADRVWRIGDRDRRGQRLSEAGFNLHVADCPREAVEEEITRFVDTARDLLIHVQGIGAEIDFHIGLMVFAKSPTSVELSAELLGSLSEQKIGLAITGYPCCDSNSD